MSVATMEELLVDELKDIYNAEKQITKALPKLVKAATSAELQEALKSHLQETEGQIDRLDQVFDILGESPRGKTCHGMQGVLEEGSEIIEEVEKSPLRDAGIISAAQRVEHYEMAAYGSAREFARLLGHEDVVSLLEATLEEEKAADQKLSTIAQTVNAEAQGEGDSEEYADEDEDSEESGGVSAKSRSKTAVGKTKTSAKSKSKSKSA